MPKKGWVDRASKSLYYGKPMPDTNDDPDTRFNTARHESGHAVVGEALSPGSVSSMAIGPQGGATVFKSPRDTQYITDLTDDDIRNMTATSLAGGLSEEGGTTPIHASGDMAMRNHIYGERASSPIQNISRLVFGKTLGKDPMLQAPQFQAEGQARANLVLSDPNKQKSIDDLTGEVSSRGHLYGDEIRRAIGGNVTWKR